MPWTKADLRIFAAGLAIGGEWNGRMPGDSMFETSITSNVTQNDIYADDFIYSIAGECIVSGIVEE